MSKDLTIGEKRVRTEFNPEGVGNVNFIKEKTAELINVLEDFKKDERHKEFMDSEVIRVISVAQTTYEDAAMWAVKAVTSKI